MSEILDRFSDMDYPGRRKPVNRQPKAKTPEDMPVWDAKPVFYLVDGQKQEFFLISHLAKALGYSVQSIRAWEAAGLLPRTPYRSPKTRRPVAAGRSNKGKRLWTREQVEGILRLAKKHRVILPDRKDVKKPPTPAFAKDVAQLFSELVGDRK
jgi:hypothetical protein